MTVEKARDELESIIVDYASDYARWDWISATSWSDVEKALDTYRDALLAPVPEHRPPEGETKC